ncbi:unnamed protein product, partial [Rotaria magnacalcarata]
MKQTAKNNRLWEVQLTITDDNDPQLSTLTDRIKQEVGHLDQAEELYQELLKSASTDSERAHIYHQLGWLKGQQEISLPPTHPNLASSYNNIGGVYDSMGEYSKALEYYEKDLEITKKALPP